MAYSRLERSMAALLDSAPGFRRRVKAGYQRVNYLLHGGRGRPVTLHPLARLESVPSAAGHAGHMGPAPECFCGYFGLSPWNAGQDRFLFHQWRHDDAAVDVCIYDLRTGVATAQARTTSWNFQQGSLAQWVPGEADTFVFNDCADGELGCRVVAPGVPSRWLPWPIEALHPDGRHALSLNFRRLWRVEPEYGYAVRAVNMPAELEDDADGLWRVDLRTGAATLLVTLARLGEIAPRDEMREAEHHVNHAVYSPSGDRFVFMHRWVGPRGRYSRLYCMRDDGSGLRLLVDHRMVSHYAWRDDCSLLAWARAPEHGDRYYLVNAESGAREPCCPGELDRFGDGHPSYSPDGQWIVTDTYPDRARIRRLLLCHPARGEVLEVGAFHAPWRYDGARRCDLHPRWNASGTLISIDSTHEGRRRTYTVDVSAIVSGGGRGHA